MNLRDAFERFDDSSPDPDDLSLYEVRNALEKLREADDPDFEQHIEMIDDAVEQFEMEFEDFKDNLEVIREVLINGETEDDEDEY